MKCRHCANELTLTLIDLGSAPPSNSYLSESSLWAPERWYPLRVLVCDSCWLAQTEDYAHHSEFFSEDYAYFSSYSSSWLKHSEQYMEEMAARFNLGADSLVVEVAANDGYLLQYAKARGIPCFGIEPTASTAAAARKRGIEIIEEFFGEVQGKALAAQGRNADLMVANNVLAHVPDVNDFLAGFAAMLADDGVATFEFPHLLRMVSKNQFDTIYHEHFSYLSLIAVEAMTRHNGLTVFDVAELPTHGGSLRVFVQRIDSGRREINATVAALINHERAMGMAERSFYEGFQARANRVKNDLYLFLVEAVRRGKRVAGYGAAAKGNTLLNYAGIRPDLLPYVVDLNPVKQGRYLPGSRIPIVTEDVLRKDRPDYVLILPWNIKAEVMQQLDYIRDWGGEFVTAVPALVVE